MSLTSSRGVNYMESLISKPLLKEFIENELDFERELFDKLFGFLNKYLDELVAEKYTGTPENMENLGLLAHKVKASCHSFGAEVLHLELQSLESASKNSDQEKTKIHFIKITEIYQDTLKLIKKISDQYFAEEDKNVA